MEQKLLTQKVLEKTFEVFHRHQLDYCIQNGYEDMPSSFPTDIDIFYRGANEKDLDFIVYEIAKESGVEVLQKVAMGYYHFVYWLSPALPIPNFQFELDFQSELSRFNCPHYYLPSRLMERKILYKGFYVPSPVDEMIYTILRRTVKHQYTERHHALLQRDFEKDPKGIETALRTELPEKVTNAILALIMEEDAHSFEKYYAIFKEYVAAQSRKNNTFAKRVSQWSYNLRRMLPLRFFRPTGMDIALLAPDGGGKSTVLEALKKYGISSFSGIERKYVRPGLFQNIGQYKPNAQPESTDNPNPHGRKPDGTLKSWIRFLVYLIDFTIGYIVKVVPLKWQRKLVVFDRYYYDYYVDMYRYHYSLPDWVPHFFSFLIPRPDMTFVLYAQADVIYERKKELSLEETQRQCEAFRKVAFTVKNAMLIDVNRPVEEVVHSIIEAIMQRRIELTGRKLKIK
jgi:hypothetical protein